MGESVWYTNILCLNLTKGVYCNVCTNTNACILLASGHIQVLQYTKLGSRSRKSRPLKNRFFNFNILLSFKQCCVVPSSGGGNLFFFKCPLKIIVMNKIAAHP